MNKLASLCALASISLMVGVPDLLMAQTPPAQPSQPAQPPAPAMQPMMPPGPAMAPATPAPEPDKTAAAEPPKPHLSACAKAIKVSERKLDKSTADASVIAAAWEQISEAKKAKGAACTEHAKQAADML